MTLDVCYNMEKNMNEPTNPIRVRFNKLDVNASSSMKSHYKGEDGYSPIQVEHSGDINATRTFYYARLRSDRFRFPETKNRLMHTAIVVELYCKVPQNRAWCDNTLDLKNIGLNSRKTDQGWYVDRGHNSALDGNVTALVPSDSNFTVEPNVIPAFEKGRIRNVYVRYNQPLNGVVETRVDIMTEPWLRASRDNIVGLPTGTPHFHLKLKSLSSLTGIGETANTIESKPQVEKNGKMDW